MSWPTLNHIFFSAAERYGGRPAVMRQRQDGRWIDISIDQLNARVRALAALLDQLGLGPGDRVAMISENRPDWAVVDYACLASRVIMVPIYPVLTAEQMRHILADAEVVAVFVSNTQHARRVRQLQPAVPSLRHVIAFDEVDLDGVLPLHSVADGAGGRFDVDKWQRDALAVSPSDLATIIYTSGTSGEPKGVMLSHGNIASNVSAALQAFPINANDDCLSFLPLSHVFERMAGHYCMFAAGAVIHYATGVEAVARELIEVRPTVVCSVPRVYENIFAAVKTKAAQSASSQRIFDWSVRVGERRLDALLAGQRPTPWLRAAYLVADRLVFAKLRARTGGRIRFFISGGAPLSESICRFFLAAGITVIEGYGLTETSPVITANRIDDVRPGTVGPVLPGIELRIADDGEILTRGPHVMQGYYRKPELTAQAIDSDGWFHTGDVGMIDANGNLRITDRKKDLIKTSAGKYVAPQPIEAMLKENPFFANAVLIGDKRRFPIMLLVPNSRALTEWAAAEGIADTELDALVKIPAVQQKLEREARKSLRGLAQFETPRKFLVLGRDFTIESGELTPTLKVRRRAVEEHYQAEIDALYT